MEIEIAGFSQGSSLRRDLEGRLNSKRADLGNLKRRITKAPQKAEPVMGAPVLSENGWGGQRQQLIQENHLLQGAVSVGYDMESIAVDVKHNLAGQGEKIQKIDGHLQGMNQDAGQASKTMNQIKQQRATYRLILYAVLGSIAAAIVVVVALKLR